MKDKTIKEKSEKSPPQIVTDKPEGVSEDAKSGDSKQSDVALKEKTTYKKEPMLKKLNKSGGKKNMSMFLGTILVVFAGIGSGWFLSGSTSAEEAVIPQAEVIEEDNGKTVGIPIQNGEEDFDEAEGILESGGIEGEGTHHLVREGGPTKYVYLTSTTLDLESFVGKTVLVKGESIAPQSAPWLMDVWVIKELE